MSRRRPPGLPPPDLYAYWRRDEHRISRGKYFYTWLLRTSESRRELVRQRNAELKDGHVVTGITDYRSHTWGYPWITKP